MAERLVFARGSTRPYLVDWDRDGHTDLVIAYRGSWTFKVAPGPLANKKDFKDFAWKSTELPPIRGAQPIHFSFADWDGDGKVDLLVGVSRGRQPGRYRIYWFRNTSSTGPPHFAEAAPLLDVPSLWELHAFTVADGGRKGCPSLVVSVSKGWKLAETGRGWWPEASELWLYRQTARRHSAPDRGNR